MSLQHIFFRRMIPVLVALVLCGASAGGQESKIDYDVQLVNMLEGYQALFTTPLDADVNDSPGDSWRLVASAINKGFLRFTVDPITDNLLRGARFYAEPGKNVTYIIITHNVLDIWSSYPSMAYSLVSMAVQDAALFFTDPQAWGMSFGDTMTVLFMKLEQYNTQALLIRDRLLPSGFLLTPYESFILDSKRKDNLSSAILYLERFSMPVTDGLYKARQAFEAGANATDLRKITNELGRALLANRKEILPGSKDEVVYPAAVAIHTWLEFSPYVIARIHNKDKKDNPLAFDQILALEKDYAEVRRLLEASRITDTPLMNHVYEGTVAGFEGRKTAK